MNVLTDTMCSVDNRTLYKTLLKVIWVDKGKYRELVKWYLAEWYSLKLSSTGQSGSASANQNDTEAKQKTNQPTKQKSASNDRKQNSVDLIPAWQHTRRLLEIPGTV